MSTEEPKQLVIRGKAVAEDENGLICLDDLWALAAAKPAQKPAKWRAGAAAKALLGALAKKIRISDILPGGKGGALIRAKPGRGNKGTFAHPILAAAYAGYLNPDLEVEVREVWLRYRAGDATLADEILQRASAEANHWAGVRALSRARRRNYTDTLKAHGVQAKGYMDCTEAVYLHLLGGKSYQIRANMKLPPKTNLRDHLDTDKLAYVMAAEALSAERIEEEDRRGNTDCAEASARSAAAIRKAIEADRKDRQKRLVA
ncbi:KilA-N domain-containing protein [Sphingomonas sp. DG1-23]|uniref:KilA-N domain-containing protein n=1 Tax=Sphingomonas sp. DG1-23 TaxID=3068316 RepID=UPI00273F8531|nr:KilA-N domain-containing protein [Sphingomonas sp. DG1-23]MDP5280621.1 KilA-N domain-containing protein [Sphingomonas sp. DG1-23]